MQKEKDKIKLEKGPEHDEKNFKKWVGRRWQKFAKQNKVKNHNKDRIEIISSVILKIFIISQLNVRSMLYCYISHQ